MDTVRIVPTADAWRKFSASADAAGVHRWQPRYMAEGVIDGSGWSLLIADDGRRVESQGSNAFPDRQGREHELEMTDEFRAFLAALSELVGTQVGF
jgi:hypothetical protein